LSIANPAYRICREASRDEGNVIFNGNNVRRAAWEEDVKVVVPQHGSKRGRRGLFESVKNLTTVRVNPGV
jgi:hypothetical protein